MSLVLYVRLPLILAVKLVGLFFTIAVKKKKKKKNRPIQKNNNNKKIIKFGFSETICGTIVQIPPDSRPYFRHGIRVLPQSLLRNGSDFPEMQRK